MAQAGCELFACQTCRYCKKGLFSACDVTNTSDTQAMLYGHNTCGIHGVSEQVAAGTQTLILCMYVHAPFLLQAVLRRRLAGSVGTMYGQLISAALAGYSALTGGYEGGQAEYARVIFGAAVAAALGRPAAYACWNIDRGAMW